MDQTSRRPGPGIGTWSSGGRAGRRGDTCKQARQTSELRAHVVGRVALAEVQERARASAAASPHLLPVRRRVDGRGWRRAPRRAPRGAPPRFCPPRSRRRSRWCPRRRSRRRPRRARPPPPRPRRPRRRWRRRPVLRGRRRRGRRGLDVERRRRRPQQAPRRGALPAALRLHGRVHVQGRDAPLDGPELRVRRPARVGQGLEDGLEARRRRRFFRLRLLLLDGLGVLS